VTDSVSAGDLLFDRWVLQPSARRILVDGQPVSIGARAYDVLFALVERRERVVTKNELFDLVWPGLVVEENNLMVQISTLRKLLGPQAIATVPGRGYRFTGDRAASPALTTRLITAFSIWALSARMRGRSLPV